MRKITVKILLPMEPDFFETSKIVSRVDSSIHSLPGEKMQVQTPTISDGEITMIYNYKGDIDNDIIHVIRSKTGLDNMIVIIEE